MCGQQCQDWVRSPTTINVVRKENDFADKKRPKKQIYNGYTSEWEYSENLKVRFPNSAKHSQQNECQAFFYLFVVSPFFYFDCKVQR